MKKVISFMHISLDGIVAGPNGELDWLHVDDEIFDFVGGMTGDADVALYGRVTYDLMESYWPTAADVPNPSKHTREHAAWYKQVDKVVLSKTLDESKLKKTKVISSDISKQMTELKQKGGKNIMIFGSPSATQALMKENVVDEYWLFINPVVKGKGIQFFKDINDTIKLKLVESKQFTSGVIGAHYEVIV